MAELKFEEYMELWTKKDPRLMDRVGMDQDQRDVVNNECKWTAAILERLGDEIQNRLVIPEDKQYRMSILMRSAMNDCRKCKC